MQESEVHNGLLSRLRESRAFKLLRKKLWYCRLRLWFPDPEPKYVDDGSQLEDSDPVEIDWPEGIQKPRIGVVRDFGPDPRWTKYCRFLQRNGFQYKPFDIHAHDWIEKAKEFDVVAGIWSCSLPALQEMREKYHVLETYMGIMTYPSAGHAALYEDKRLEYYLAVAHGLPFAETFISNSREDALDLIERLPYPVVSKIIPASGSVGVELVSNPRQAQRIVQRAFSSWGRKTHLPYARQKNYVYFQKFVANDGWDIRVILAGPRAFGYYRKVLEGDFRASGMNLVEKRALPEKAVRIARKLNAAVGSPVLVVDMVRTPKDEFYIIEYSPICQMSTPEQLHHEGVPGAYVFDSSGELKFEATRLWVHELGLKEFLLHHYLPRHKTPCASGAMEKVAACCGNHS